MARKFLYVIAAIVVLVILALLALRIWSDELTEFTFVPRSAYEEQAPLDSTVYAEPKMWFAWPSMEMPNPAHFTPQGLTGTPAPLPAAVFFVHPTSYLAKEHWNAPLDDNESRDRSELFIRAMASPFATSEELWVPRYRQAAFGAFLTDSPDAAKALDLAYGDVLAAFDEFIQSSDPSLPIVLAGHSQGAFHLKRLLLDRVAGKPLARRIAAVYAVGWPISIEHDLPLMGLPACTTPDQAGCVMSWLSFAEPADTSMILNGYARRPALDGKSPGGSPFLCSNPLTGGIGGSAPASANLGTLVPSEDLKTGRLEKGMVPARCDADGFLMIGEPPKLGAYVLPGNNFHVYDIPLFWANLRADAARRVQAWKP
jgi:hypothetical protein